MRKSPPSLSTLPHLSGSDVFHLLVDRKMLRHGQSGNISRIQLELEPNADLETIADRLLQNRTLRQVSNLRVAKGFPFAKWETIDRKTRSVEIHSALSNAEFEQRILNRQVDNDNGLVFIDLYGLESGSKHMLISMHHVLFDHRGMVNFVRCLADEKLTLPLFDPEQPKALTQKLLNAARMTITILSRASGKLGVLMKKKDSQVGIPRFRIIAFTELETSRIEQNAWNNGSRIGRSAFYMACVAKSVQNVLEKRGEHPPFLWFSVPHDMRKKGTQGHLVSNQLSFLFFRLTKSDLQSIKTSVEALNSQLREQLKNNMVVGYSDLQDAMRAVPMPIYEGMVDLASAGKMSSFGYSDLGENPIKVTEMCGTKVQSVLHYPPVPSPPGFNSVVVKENGRLKFVWGYVAEALSETEMEEMENEFREMLLNP